MKIAYCRECKVAIAAGALVPQRVIVVQGKQRVVNTMPSHEVGGKSHRNVGLIDVPDQPIPIALKPEEMERFFKYLSKKHKEEFK
jgi:hypothetical protein